MKRIFILLTFFTTLLTPLKFAIAVNPSGVIHTNENPYTVLPTMVIKKIIDLTPKELEKHLSFKEKITFKFLKWKLKRHLKQRPEKLSDGKFDKLGRMSMIFGIGAFVLVFLPFATFLVIPAALLAIILGAVSINKVKNKTNSIIGIVLGSALLILLLIAIAVFVSIFSGPW